MTEPEIEKVAQRLDATLAWERRQAVAYALLTALCTPAFVAIVSVVAAAVVLQVMQAAHHRVDTAAAIYTGMTLFLASAVGLTAVSACRSRSEFELDRNWLAGAGLLVILCVVTYLTPLREETPVFFGVLYAALGFLVLGLVGRMQANRPPESAQDEPLTFHGLVAAVAGFVVSAYAELLSASWLWFPPKPHDVRIAARVLCRLGADDKGPLHECVVDDHIERLLVRLKLVQRVEQQLSLTPKGLDFVRATPQTETMSRSWWS